MMAPKATPTQEPDIPELRRKRKERRAGGFWQNGNSGASGIPLGGAGMAGVGAGHSSLLGSIAGTIAQALGTGTTGGILLASKLGPALVAGAVGLFGLASAGAGIAAYRVLGPAPAPYALSVASQGGSETERSAAFAAAANAEGEAASSESRPQGASLGSAPAEASGPGAAIAAPMSAAAQNAASSGARAAGTEAAFAALEKLTSSGEAAAAKMAARAPSGAGALALAARQQSLSTFGGIRRFTRVPTLGRLRSLTKNPSAAQGGPAAPPARGRSIRAMGQLKLAGRFSRLSNLAETPEGQQAFNTAAFEQSTPNQGGKQVPQAPLGQDNGVPNALVPLGEGAPTAPAIQAESNVTPYQDQLDKAHQDSISANSLIASGAALAMAGAIGAGIAMILAGVRLGRAAMDTGDQIKAQYGQPQQGDIVSDSAEQYMKLQTVRPAEFRAPPTGVGEAVDVEANSGYLIDLSVGSAKGAAKPSSSA